MKFISEPTVMKPNIFASLVNVGWLRKTACFKPAIVSFIIILMIN